MGAIAFAASRNGSAVGTSNAPAAVSMPAAPLAFTANGSTVTVDRVTGPAQTRQHLEHLGFVPGATVKVESQQQGDIIVCVKGVKLGIDAATARRVMVR
jgi:ferrous iron transport protein A